MSTQSKKANRTANSPKKGRIYNFVTFTPPNFSIRTAASFCLYRALNIEISPHSLYNTGRYWVKTAVFSTYFYLYPLPKLNILSLNRHFTATMQQERGAVHDHTNLFDHLGRGGPAVRRGRRRLHRCLGRGCGPRLPLCGPAGDCRRYLPRAGRQSHPGHDPRLRPGRKYPPLCAHRTARYRPSQQQL